MSLFILKLLRITSFLTRPCLVTPAMHLRQLIFLYLKYYLTVPSLSVFSICSLYWTSLCFVVTICRMFMLYSVRRDADSVCVRQLLVKCLIVVQRTHPRHFDASLKTNHGTGHIVVAPKINSFNSFQHRLVFIEVRMCCGSYHFRSVVLFSCCIVYRPGSSAVSGTFFIEL